MIKRRNFLLGAGCLVAPGVVSKCALAATPRKIAVRDVNLTRGFSKAKFEALLNQTFYIDTHDHGVVTVKLVEVQPGLVKTSASNTLEQFSVTFLGLLLPPLPSGLYEVSHLTAGRVSLYLKALPLQGSQPLYRVDFSLLR
jgi:hypothetical protein